jgi:hypothetical protein
MRDRGENVWHPRRLKDAARAGHGLAAYLNRYEGVVAEGHTAGDLDRMPDAAFGKAVPHARDSLILLDPGLVIETRCIRPSKTARHVEAHHGTSLSNLLSIIAQDAVLGDRREEAAMEGFSLSSSFEHACAYAQDKSKEEARGLADASRRTRLHAIERKIDATWGGGGAVATFDMGRLRRDHVAIEGYSTATGDDDDDGHEVRVLVDDWTRDEAAVSGILSSISGIRVREDAKWETFAAAAAMGDRAIAPAVEAMRRLIGRSGGSTSPSKGTNPSG